MRDRSILRLWTVKFLSAKRKVTSATKLWHFRVWVLSYILVLLTWRVFIHCKLIKRHCPGYFQSIFCQQHGMVIQYTSVRTTCAHIAWSRLDLEGIKQKYKQVPGNRTQLVSLTCKLNQTKRCVCTVYTEWTLIRAFEHCICPWTDTSQCDLCIHPVWRFTQMFVRCMNTDLQQRGSHTGIGIWIRIVFHADKHFLHHKDGYTHRPSG